MKPISTSTYTFSKLIEGGFVYIDKTEQIYRLLRESTGQYFMSRPRRFGKSLMISTLECIFKGRRELFKGLAIDSLEYDWKKYPVIRLDMGSTQADTPEELKMRLSNMCMAIAEQYGVSLDGLIDGSTAPDYFLKLVYKLAEQSETGKVVILIDEYDKPLLNHIGKNDAIPYRDILKSFYSVIKTTESMQRFAFITGVSKFTKVSIFSDLNNLTDLTMDSRAATLVGYTKEEVKKFFAEHIPVLAKKIGKTEEETIDRLECWYDGFRFSEEPVSVFNPVSVGKCCDTLKFDNYWFETATPTFLMELLRKDPLDLQDLTVSKSDFSNYEVEDPAVLPLLVQTGYLTIKGTVEKKGRMRYCLGYPNQEVADSFTDSILKAFTGTKNAVQTKFIDKMINALESGNIEEIFDLMPPFFAQIPNNITLQNEKYYQTIFFAMFKMIGTMVDAEVNTNNGRIDAVIETPKFVYIFEFKLNDTAEVAMKQIHEKKYYERYLGSGKKISLVAVAFDQATRNIGKHIVEVL